MYRHFYFRLCDIIDSAALVETDGIDFEDLRKAAQAAGIWEGTATYLAIVSDYVESYRGNRVELPQVRQRSSAIRRRRRLLRARLYSRTHHASVCKALRFAADWRGAQRRTAQRRAPQPASLAGNSRGGRHEGHWER